MFSLKKPGRLSIIFVCIILGIMLAVQFRTTKDISSSVPFQRIEDLSQQLIKAEKEIRDLTKQNEELKQKSEAELAAKNLETIQMAAGLITVEGPGIIVTIDDSKRVGKLGENPNLYLIHDDDILKVINELWAAGAEAMSINDQRIIASSEIRCAGPTLSVNNTRCAAPYEVKVIGNSKNLENSLKMRGGVIETLQFWGIQISIKKQDVIQIPKYKGSMKYEYAKPIKEEVVGE
ncbi:DUF881 domain-containing protein [Selenomonadales bacterium OttesenSCG-928-I06]|nr:DUF881 domain-containing protein [Selenomonadales bacterium OttesenSCG-928-I06]